KYGDLPYYRDRYLLPVRITDHVRKRENTIEISCDFYSPGDEMKNLDRMYGKQIEQIYLVEEFGVKGKLHGKDKFETVRHRFAPQFTIVAEKSSTEGDLLLDGYCFFNGTIKLEAKIDVPEVKQNERCYLE